MSIASAIMEGLAGGLQDIKYQKDKRQSLQDELDKQKALEIFRGIVSGDITPAGAGQTPTVTMPGQPMAPKGIGDALMRGFGLRRPQYTKEQGYVKTPTTMPKIEEGQMVETSYDELGRPKGFKITETPERKLEREVQKKELMSMAEKLPSLERAETAIKELKQSFTKGWTAQSVGKKESVKGIQERMRGALAIPFQSWTQTNPDLRVYLEDKGAFASLISKGGFMEAGVLTNQDIKRVLDALPQPGDSGEVVKKGWKIIENVMGEARRNFEIKKAQYTGKSIQNQLTKEGSLQDNKVIMKSPDGYSYEVDVSEVEEALNHGWTK